MIYSKSGTLLNSPDAIFHANKPILFNSLADSIEKGEHINFIFILSQYAFNFFHSLKLNEVLFQ